MNKPCKTFSRIWTVVFTTVFLCACSEDRDLPIAEIDCHTGLYETSAGEQLSLTPLPSDRFRWRMLSGRTGALNIESGISTLGWTNEPDGWAGTLSTCDEGVLSLGPAGAQQRYERINLEVTDTTFVSEGAELAGRLVWPVNTPKAPLAVLIHGSEKSSALRNNPMPYMLAAQGIASFVYDKRGTGISGGSYSQDFHLLAADARAALKAAQELAGDRIASEGYLGASQGGWVAPLAASQSEVDFVVVLFGLAVNALTEDRSQVIQGLEQAGWDAEVQAKGAALADAAGVVMASRFRSGFEEFDRLRDLYENEPWYTDVVGEFTGQFLSPPSLALRVVGPFYDVGTSWDYEPIPVLQSLKQRQLWMMAADDEEAPSGESIQRLQALQDAGVRIDLAAYADSGHGMVLRERSESGELREVSYVKDYYRQIAAWIVEGDLSYATRAGAAVSRPARM